MTTAVATSVGTGSQDDLLALRELPALALRLGYFDVYLAYGSLHVRSPKMLQELPALPKEIQSFVRLFGLGEGVEATELLETLGETRIAALERLGVLLRDKQGRLHTGGFLLLPLLGQLLFVPAPRQSPLAFFGDDSAALLVRLAPSRGARVLSLCAGIGAPALRAATIADKVVAVEDNELSLACAEINIAMHGMQDRVTLRRGAGLDALENGERFGYVCANPVPQPFPAALFRKEDTEPTQNVDSPAEQIVRLLPTVLDEAGVAQIVAADLGNKSGPRLVQLLTTQAEEHSLAVTLTVISSPALNASSKMLRSLARHRAQLSGLTIDESEQRMLAYLQSVGCDRMQLFFLTASRGLVSPGIKQCRPDLYGGGFWQR